MTGGSSGIGLATARLAVARGAKVSLVARRADVLESGGDRHAGRWRAGRRSRPPTWPTRPRSVSRCATLTDAFGPVDIVVCSAGQARPGYFQELDPDLFRSDDGRELLRHGQRRARGRAGDDRTPPRKCRGRVVGGRAGRRVRLHRVHADEVRGARVPRVVPGRAAAVRHPRGLLVPARHRHAAARGREQYKPQGDEGDLRNDQAALCGACGARASSRASRRNASDRSRYLDARPREDRGPRARSGREGDGPLGAQVARSTDASAATASRGGSRTHLRSATPRARTGTGSGPNRG